MKRVFVIVFLLLSSLAAYAYKLQRPTAFGLLPKLSKLHLHGARKTYWPVKKVAEYQSPYAKISAQINGIKSMVPKVDVNGFTSHVKSIAKAVFRIVRTILRKVLQAMTSFLSYAKNLVVKDKEGPPSPFPPLSKLAPAPATPVLPASQIASSAKMLTPSSQPASSPLSTTATATITTTTTTSATSLSEKKTTYWPPKSAKRLINDADRQYAQRVLSELASNQVTAVSPPASSSSSSVGSKQRFWPPKRSTMYQSSGTAVASTTAPVTPVATPAVVAEVVEEDNDDDDDDDDHTNLLSTEVEQKSTGSASKSYFPPKPVRSYSMSANSAYASFDEEFEEYYGTYPLELEKVEVKDENQFVPTRTSYVAQAQREQEGLMKYREGLETKKQEALHKKQWAMKTSSAPPTTVVSSLSSSSSLPSSLCDEVAGKLAYEQKLREKKEISAHAKREAVALAQKMSKQSQSEPASIATTVAMPVQNTDVNDGMRSLGFDTTCQEIKDKEEHGRLLYRQKLKEKQQKMRQKKVTDVAAAIQQNTIENVQLFSTEVTPTTSDPLPSLDAKEGPEDRMKVNHMKANNPMRAVRGQGRKETQTIVKNGFAPNSFPALKAKMVSIAKELKSRKRIPGSIEPLKKALFLGESFLASKTFIRETMGRIVKDFSDYDTISQCILDADGSIGACSIVPFDEGENGTEGLLGWNPSFALDTVA